MTSSVKKLFAGMSAVAIALTQAGSVFAAYSDVPAGVWFEEAVEAFTDAGYLDATQTRFRGGDNANRAEFIKLVVELNGGILSTPPAVPSFGDVATGAWYYGYMEEAAKEGWLQGDNACYTTGLTPCMARPGANINRAEAAALIVRAFALEGTDDAPAFVDVPAGQWYSEVVQTAADHCVLQGDDATGRARPGDPMNRAEMVVMLNRVDMGLTYGVDCKSEGVVEAGIKDVTALSEDTVEVEFTVAVDETAAAVAASYAISGDADIDVESVEVVDDMTVELTLAEATDADGDYTVTVTDMEAADGDTFSDSMDFSGYTALVRGDGILEVSVASSSPDGDTVPKGAVGVVMLSLDLEASCDDDVTIEEITVLHDGFGATTNIDGVYVSVDGSRISRKRSLNSSDQTANLRLTSPLTITACRTETIDIVADIAVDGPLTTDDYAAGGEHNFAVEMKTDFQSNAKEVQGSFPMGGNTFTVATVSSGTVDFAYRTVSPNQVDVGTDKVLLGKFEIEANSTEDQALYSLTLEQTGTASEGDIANLRLARTDGTVLTNTVASTTGDYVTFKFDPPRIILAGDTLTVNLYGDIVGGAADTVLFNLEEDGDLFAVGSLYGKGRSGQLFGSPVTESAEPGASQTVTLQAGQLTVEIDGPSQKKYTEDSDDATLAKVIITPGAEAVDIRSMYVAILATDSGSTAYTTAVTAALEDVTLRNTKTGRAISATTVGTLVTGGYQFYRFDDFLIDKQETFELQVDFIAGGPATGDRFQAILCASNAACSAPALTAIRAEGVTTGKTLTDIRPGSNITGSVHLVIAPELTITVNSIGTGETTVRKAQNLTLLRFEATPGEASDILLTGAKFEEDGTADLRFMQNYALWVDSDNDFVVDTVLEKGVAASGQTGDVSFSKLNNSSGWPIPASQTVLFELRGDVASNPVSGSTIKLKLVAMTSDGIQAEDVDSGSSIAGTDITYNSASSKLFTIVAQGDLFVREDNKPRSRQILAGTVGDSVLRIEMRSQYEDIEVKEINIAATGATAAPTGIVNLDLFKDNETTAFATATTCTAASKFEEPALAALAYCVTLPANKLIVKKTAPTIITVRPRVNNDKTGGDSYKGLYFWMGTGSIAGTGLQSSNELSENDNDGTSEGEIVYGRTTAGVSARIVGNTNDIVRTKFSAITNKLPAKGIPTGTNQEIARFEFTAPTNTNADELGASATLSGVIFTVAASNMNFAGNTFEWFRTGKELSTEKAACSVLGAPTTSGALKVYCNDPTGAVNKEVKSGESVQFSLEVDVDNHDIDTAANSTLQVSITNFSNRTLTTFAATTSNIHWTDSDLLFFWVENAESTVYSTQMSQ